MGYRVSKARLPKAHDNLTSRLIIAGLTLAQPVLRGWTRYKTVWSLKRNPGVAPCPLPLTEAASCDEASLPRIGFFRRLGATAGILAHRLSFHRFFWNSKGLEREDLLGSIIGLLHTLGVRHTLDSGFAISSSTPPWDLAAKVGHLTTARLRVTVENHGGEKRFVRLAGSVLPSALSVLALLGLAAAAATATVVVSPVAGLACAGAVLLLVGWLAVGLYRAASLVTTLTQYVMVTRPGCSLSEPEEVRAARTVVRTEADMAAPEILTTEAAAEDVLAA